MPRKHSERSTNPSDQESFFQTLLIEEYINVLRLPSTPRLLSNGILEVLRLEYQTSIKVQ